MKKRILVVDDEKSFTRMLKLNLEETGKYEVRTENKGTKTLLAAKEFKPDLILLDVLMPDMDGGWAASQILADKSVENIPIVFLTAVTTKEETDARCKIIGGKTFMAKPVRIKKLIECIEENIIK
ncbi:MAG: response regulator [Omnitrophica bacterium]|nr:response regulator [Candidatus Omnitrophota bacterium]